MKTKKKTQPQGALFEDDYLIRALGTIAGNSEVALTELVANSRDAGASRVNVIIPETRDCMLVVEDDGTGMTAVQFRLRWMTLGYDRQRHQGAWVEYPPGRVARRRRAFGRNGAGRHGMLCFADSYAVETICSGKKSTFHVSTTVGKNPFTMIANKPSSSSGHGTRISAIVARNLPDPEHIRQVLGSRFLQDPEFAVSVNGTAVPLTNLAGFVEEDTLQVTDELSVRAMVFDSHASSRIVAYQGIAFWVSGKLVGNPSWILGDRAILDGRTRAGRRFSVVVQCEDALAEAVESDWMSFKKTTVRDRLWKTVGDYVSAKTSSLMKDQAAEIRFDALHEYREEIRDLPRLAALEVVDFATELTAAEPDIASSTLSMALQAVINLEKSRHGSSLLEKLARLPDHDIEALDRMLSEWSAHDALTVLDEIDSRLKVVEAIDRLGKDESADELRTLHPLVTQARWIFGPEFDSPEFSSNESLRNAVAAVFKRRVPSTAFLNSRKRPDLVVLSDATLSVVATESVDSASGLSRLMTVLLVELKKGRSAIGREEMNQADGYVQDLLQCGHLEGVPFIRAFVVGHQLGDRTEPTKAVGEGPKARIDATTYSQLTRTASKRLFKLRERLKERYESMASDKLLDEVLGAPSQLSLGTPKN